MVAKLADNGATALQWDTTPGDLALIYKAMAILAIPKMVDVLQLVLFALTDDANNNAGKVDRDGLVWHVRTALAAAGVQL